MLLFSNLYYILLVSLAGFPDNYMIASLLEDVENARPETPAKPPAGNAVHPTRPVPAPRNISPHPVPAPRSKSPMPVSAGGTSAPVVPPRPKSVSPIPTHTQGGTGIHPPHGVQPPNQASADRPYWNIGSFVSEEIGGVKGAIGSAITDIQGYLQIPQQPVHLQETPVSPFEIVPHPAEQHPPAQHTANNPYKSLYPQLSVEYSGPCTKGQLLSCGKFGAGVDLFLKPFGLAVGRHGEFIVSDRGGNRIFVFSNEGEQKCRFSMDCTVNHIAVTKDNHILVAVAKSGSAIMRMYSMEGRPLQQFGNFYKYDESSGIVITPSDHVAITNIAANNVLLFTAQRKFSLKFGSKGAGDKHFNQPRHVTATSKDYLIVSDTGNNCLKLLDKEGNFKRSFGSFGNAHGQLNSPLGIACDSEDNIIVADANNFRVEVFTVKGGFYTTVVEDTYLIGPDVRPINVAVTTRNNIVVLLYGTGFAEVRIYNWRPNHKGGI